VTWDEEKVLEDLKSFPLPPPLINWQKFAREHDVPGRNCGQVVQEFAQQSGIDTLQLDNRAPATPSRSEKRKMPGGEISASADPTPATIRGEIVSWWRALTPDGGNSRFVFFSRQSLATVLQFRPTLTSTEECQTFVRERG